VSKSEPSYDLAAITELLLDAFNAEDLRRLCRNRPTFRPILKHLGPQFGLDDIVDQVIDYCDTHRLFDQLLDAVREERPAQVAHFEPRLRASPADRIAVKILKPGSTLLSGRYRIDRHIGRGGFGSVYLAEDTLLREQVAIKELIPALVGDDAALKRFLVEGKATMQLAHPHIVRTRDLFEAEGNYYIVMEHMPGGSLEDQIKAHKTLPVDDAVRLLAEVCDGLAYAHARGVVHCDLKPSNVLLTADPKEGAACVAKVADFGVAHVSDQMVTKSWITPGGFAGGTLPYMSPEQTDGVRDDPRVDVYALGAVLYRALTGRTYLDFDQRDTPRAQAGNVQRISTHEPAPPSTHNPRIPAWLDAVVLKALAKRPDDRYAGVADLRSALLSGESAPAAAPRLAPRPSPTFLQTLAARLRRAPAWLWPAAGGAVLLLVALLIAIPLLGGGGPGPTATFTPSPVAPVVSSTPAPAGITPTVEPSPQGRIAFVSNRDGNTDIYVMNADGSGVTRLTNDSHPDEAPFSWSPDGRQIAFARPFGDADIYVMNADGSNQTRLTNDVGEARSPAWSPDGQRIAFASERDGNSEIYVMNTDGSGHTRLTNDSSFDSYPAWSPDGRRIAFASERDGDGEIYVMNADGSEQTNLTNSPDDEWLPSWSPDGQRIAFMCGPYGREDICAMNADGSGRMKLTNNAAANWPGGWSPGGRYIVFMSMRDGNSEIYIMPVPEPEAQVNADGSGVTRLTNNPGDDWWPVWSPSQSTVATPTPPPPLSLDDFEGYAANADLQAAYQINCAWTIANTAELRLSDVMIPTAGGSHAAAFGFDIRAEPPQDYCGFERIMESQDWQPYTALHLWVRGDGSDRTLVVQFGETSGEVWKTRILLSKFGVKEFLLALDQQTFAESAIYPELAGPGAEENQNGRIDLAAIKYYGFFVGHGSMGPGDIYIDNVELR